MRIFGISVIKNESDIIEYSLTKASEWAEKIFVLDNGSEDGTWEIVKKVAERNKKIVAWRQSFETFTDGLRADVFNEFKHLAEPGDWWCMRLDSDEFYVEDPNSFLKNIKNYYHVVCSRHIQYRLTSQDIENPPQSIPELIASLKYYEPVAYSEIRFFRHRDRLVWDKKNGRPTHIGLVSPERILIKHYQYRSVQQVKTRIAVRYGLTSHMHVKEQDWRKYIHQVNECIFDNGDIQEYKKLPLANNKSLEYRWWVFWLRRFMHTSGILP